MNMKKKNKMNAFAAIFSAMLATVVAIALVSCDNDLEVGDTVLTTSGFYGVLIDISDEDVIVEFGSNKNCRIPMKKSAIAEVEKAEESK